VCVVLGAYEYLKRRSCALPASWLDWQSAVWFARSGRLNRPLTAFLFCLLIRLMNHSVHGHVTHSAQDGVVFIEQSPSQR